MLFCRQEKFRLNNGTIIKNGCGFTCIFAKNTVMTPRIPNSSPIYWKACIEKSKRRATNAGPKIDRMLFACSNSRSPGTRADTKFYPSRARISVALVRRSWTHGSRQKANAAWREADVKLKNEIMLRHYSPKTLKSYLFYTQKFRGFMVNKDPSLLDTQDIKNYLTDMAVNKQSSASAQKPGV